MKYKEYKENVQNALNEFIKDKVFFAFGKNQLDEAFEKYGIKDESDFKDRYMGFCGGACLKSEIVNLEKFRQDQIEELKECLKDEDFFFEAATYEIENYEATYTGDYSNVEIALLLWKKSDFQEKFASGKTKAEVFEAAKQYARK